MATKADRYEGIDGLKAYAMNEQQIRLDTAVHGINSNGIERQRELNKGYLQELKAFLTDLNTLNRKNSHSDFIWKLR